MPGQPFLTQSLVFGASGIDLNHSVDQIPPTKLARLTNVTRAVGGELTVRYVEDSIGSTNTGLTNYAIARLSNPQAGTYRRFIAGNTIGTPALFSGTTGAFTPVEDGWSGNPLAFVPYRPPLSGQTWMFVADSNKMRKVDIAALSLQIGLPAPSAFAVLPTVGAPLVTTIDTCEAAGWTNNTGTGAGAPSNAVDAVNFKEGAASVQFTTNNGGGGTPYYQFWNKANALDLSLVGTETADDDDIIHIWLRADRPDLLQEVRLYFVVSAAFNTATLPGASTTLNTEAYVKGFRPSDLSNANEGTATSLAGSTTSNTNVQTTSQLDALAASDERGGAVAVILKNLDVQGANTPILASGRGAWTEFGAIALPLRRGDFRRIGSDTTRTWANVSGLVVLVQSTTTTNVNVWIDDISLRGGYGPDTTRVGASAINYRATNYDPRTGAESNPGPLMDEDDWLDAARAPIDVTPNAFGDANIRQRVYRQGGALKNNWYFVGVNTGDGVPLTDELTDAALIAAATLELDNDQPVTTVNSAGTTVLAQPLPALWGPVQDILFGCGDPYRPGYVYWCKPTEPDSWPSTNNVEVCSPSEELMAGCVYGSQSFVFSRQRMYGLIPNLTSPGTVTGIPTACSHGLVNRWALSVGIQGIYFVSNDGVYLTTGGEERNVADADLRSIFRGETRNGYVPINFALPNNIRLTYHDNELWLIYSGQGDASTVRRIFIYNTLYDFWRACNYSTNIGTVYSEFVPGGESSLLAVRTAQSSLYQLADPDAVSPAGLTLDCVVRTGALDQGFPRQNKLYGDLTLDLDRQGGTVTVTPYINNETSSLAPITISTGSGRTRYTLSPFGSGPQLARNLSLDITWSAIISVGVMARVRLYSAQIAYLIQPDTTVQRVTDWAVEGRPTDKWVKGLILELDTFGSTKTLDLQADGATQTSITVPAASGRRVLQFPMAGATWSQFRGRLLRVVPTDSNEWMLYKYDWIFDEEPLQLLKWETQEIDHGVPMHHSLLAGYICLRSSAAVTLTITGVRQTGVTFSDAYTIASTAGVKLKPFVPFNARKAVLWKYVFESTATFWLYREESEVIVQPWGGAPTPARPFGSDDLDRVRSMSSAAGVAAAEGGGRDF